jgi:hypothetical protein
MERTLVVGNELLKMEWHLIFANRVETRMKSV